MYFTYILRCIDGSLYTGITTDVERRFKEHIEGVSKGAKYTARHKPLKIEAVWQSETRSLASKLEARIKKLSKAQKEELILNSELEIFFADEIDISAYSSGSLEK
ncbi:MAG: GIY-YIG nuclease family protein [Clostridia bacterium]|nr:GIY-YIG nuclease family protein [Clostridia bacterium]